MRGGSGARLSRARTGAAARARFVRDGAVLHRGAILPSDAESFA